MTPGYCHYIIGVIEAQNNFVLLYKWETVLIIFAAYLTIAVKILAKIFSQRPSDSSLWPIVDGKESHSE